MPQLPVGRSPHLPEITHKKPLKFSEQPPIRTVHKEDSVFCKKCNSESVSKAGSYTARGIKVQRFKCSACLGTFSKRTNSKYYRKRVQRKASMITSMYCEGMSLRAIGRVLKINRKTVEKYFLEASYEAREAHSKTLSEGEIVTTYIQCDEMETFEHGHKRPLGIQLAIRPKTGQIITAKVCRIPMRAVTATKQAKQEYAVLNTRSRTKAEMLIEVSKVIEEGGTIRSDGKYLDRSMLKTILPTATYKTSTTPDDIFMLNKICLKIRQDISRMRRRTLSTTKKMERLQNHLDLYVHYNNTVRITVR